MNLVRHMSLWSVGLALLACSASFDLDASVGDDGERSMVPGDGPPLPPDDRPPGLAMTTPPDPWGATEAVSPPDDEVDPVAAAASLDTPGGKVVTEALAEIEAGTIVKGSCWDWVHHVFNEAGYPPKKRKKVFRTKPKGPYADLGLIEAGDWLMFVNLSYGNVGHSGIFLYWVDEESHEAMIMSYKGSKSASPGRLKTYDISYVYGIQRGDDG